MNLYIQRCGNRIPPLTVAELGSNLAETREKLPRFAALFAPGQFRWTAVGILTSMCAGTAYYLIAILLPKALIEQGLAVTTGFAITTIVFLATIPGKAFNAVLMERWGRRWAIAYAMSGAFPGLILMATAHLGGDYAGIMMTTGAIVLGFTALSSFTIVRGKETVGQQRYRPGIGPFKSNDQKLGQPEERDVVEDIVTRLTPEDIGALDSWLSSRAGVTKGEARLRWGFVRGVFDAVLEERGPG